MNKSFLKAICSSLILSIFVVFNVFPCKYVYERNFLTDPCVELYSDTERRVDRYILLCGNSRMIKDHWGRTLPFPCDALGEFCLDWSFAFPGHHVGHLFFYHIEYGRHNGQSYKIQTRLSFRPITMGRPASDCQIYQKKNFAPIGSITNEGFSPQTKVTMASGEQRTIGSLDSGDRILCYDFQKSCWSSALVISSVRKKVNGYNRTKISVGQSGIACGEAQKFFLAEDKKWVQANQLKSGDKLLARELGKENEFSIVPVSSVASGDKFDPVELVFITLENHHNFVVENAFLVHNCSVVLKGSVVYPVFCPDAFVVQGQNQAGENFIQHQPCRNSRYGGGTIAFYNPKTGESGYDHEIEGIMSCPPQSLSRDFQLEMHNSDVLERFYSRVTQRVVKIDIYIPLVAKNSEKPPVNRAQEARERREEIRQYGRDFRQQLHEDLQDNMREIIRRDAPRQEMIAERMEWEDYASCYDRIENRKRQLEDADRQEQFNQNMQNYRALVAQAQECLPERQRVGRLYQQLDGEMDMIRDNRDVNPWEELPPSEHLYALDQTLGQEQCKMMAEEAFGQKLADSLSQALESISANSENPEEALSEKAVESASAFALANALKLPSIADGYKLLNAGYRIASIALLSSGLFQYDSNAKDALIPIVVERTASAQDIEKNISQTIEEVSVFFHKKQTPLTPSDFNSLPPPLTYNESLSSARKTILPQKFLYEFSQTQDFMAKIAVPLINFAIPIAMTGLGLLTVYQIGRMGLPGLAAMFTHSPIESVKLLTQGVKGLFNTIGNSYSNLCKALDKSEPRLATELANGNGKPILESCNDVAEKTNILKNSSSNNPPKTQTQVSCQKALEKAAENERIAKYYEAYKPFEAEIKEACERELVEARECLVRLEKTNLPVAKDVLKKSLERVDKENIRYMTMETYSKVSEFGKDLFQNSTPTDSFYTFSRSGMARIYQAKESLEKYGIEKGDFFYLDLSHGGDHVEVFHGYNNTVKELWKTAKTVINFDGKEIYHKKMEAFGYILKNNVWEFKQELFRQIRCYV